MHFSRGCQAEAGCGAQQLPGLADPCAWHSRGASYLHQQRLSATAVRTGAAGVHVEGARGSRLLWGSAVLGDSVRWASLLLLQLVLHRCSAGHLLFMGGCYNIGAAGSGVCREARDGACVRYAEGYMVDGGRHGTSVGVRAAAACTQPTNQQNCATDMCEMVGATEICTQCNQGKVPIDGTCTAVDDTSKAKCKKDATTDLESNAQVCGACGDGYFLHKGGCYQFGGAVGKLICTDPSTPSNTITAGACTACAPGYFKNPTQAVNKPPCIACNDTTGDGTSMGKAGCATCNPPNQPGPATCLTCLDGYYNSGSESSVTCAECNAACATCSGDGANKCTSCKEADKYLKTDSSAGTSQCVTEAACKQGGTHFPTTDKTSQIKVCALCGDAANGGIDGCTTCTPKAAAGLAEAPSVTCSACTTPTKKPNTTGTSCVACNIENCANCDKENVCEACTSSKKLSPLKDACLTDCPAGTYDDKNICKPCHTSCASCESNANQDSCTACYPGHVLNRTTDSGNTGACIPECTGRYAENCADGQCTANIGGSKYCSKCKSGFAPVDGMCVSATTRAPTGCTPGDGVCNSCTGTYFKESGGCYQSTAYPGKTLCETASNGKCTKCANGQTYASGNCPACAEGCAKCATDTNQCDTCYSGYYKSGTKCVKCDTDDSNIKGIPNCVSCAPPAISGPVTCYVTQDPSVDPADPSVNKSGLSTGAIAGISVAAVVVVGGLVGFLCWWFICRGKA